MSSNFSECRLLDYDMFIQIMSYCEVRMVAGISCANKEIYGRIYKNKELKTKWSLGELKFLIKPKIHFIVFVLKNGMWKKGKSNMMDLVGYTFDNFDFPIFKIIAESVVNTNCNAIRKYSYNKVMERVVEQKDIKAITYFSNEANPVNERFGFHNCMKMNFGEACSCGDLNLVKLFVENTDLIKSHGEICLRKAVEKKKLEIIQYLVENNVDPSFEDSKVLDIAIENENVEMIQFLIRDKRVNPSAYLVMAIEDGYIETVRSLLQDSRVNLGFSNDKAIKTAIACNNLEIIKILLEDPRIVINDENSYSIFIYANEEEIIKLLLKDKRFNPASNESEFLVYACQHSGLKKIKLLLEDGRADPTARENFCIRRAIEYSDLKVLELLQEDSRVFSLENCIKIAEQASKHGNRKVIDFLFQNEKLASFVFKGEAFVLAAINGHCDIVEKFLKNGLDPNRPFWVIIYACDFGQYYIVKLLLKDGRTNPHANDNACISLACIKGHQTMVELLMKDERVNPFKKILKSKEKLGLMTNDAKKDYFASLLKQ